MYTQWSFIQTKQVCNVHVQICHNETHYSYNYYAPIKIMLCKRSQSQKATCMIPLHEMPRTGKSVETEICVFLGLGAVRG